MQLMNCTPHKFTFEDFITRQIIDVPPSGTIIRTRTNSVFDRVLELPSRRHITINESKGINIVGLPDENPEVMLIVSAIAAADIKTIFPDRNDIYSPDLLIRDNKGRIIGCKALMKW